MVNEKLNKALVNVICNHRNELANENQQRKQKLNIGNTKKGNKSNRDKNRILTTYE